MTDETIRLLLYRASIEGLKGNIVTGFTQGTSATSSPIPSLLSEKYVCNSATEDDLRG